MKRLKCSELEPGMVVAEEILGKNGEMLLPAGAKLNERNINTLKLREISIVTVEGEGEDPFKNFTTEQITEVEKEIAGRYLTEISENSVVSQLVRLCTLRKLQKIYPEGENLQN